MTLFEHDVPDAPSGPTVRVRLDVAYDGSGFHGFAENVGVRTVAGVLRQALERVLGHRVVLTGAGRTDRGVHARGQVVTFDASADRVDAPALARSLNKLLGPSIAIRAASVVPDGFDARFSAIARVYRYRILNTPVHDPLLAGFAWHVPTPLDVNAMRIGADALLGEHDFTSFCRRPAPGADGSEPSMRRRVHRARWRELGDGLLEFEIEAASFCHQMVRSIVGTLVDMGAGRRKAGDMLAILAARDRAVAGRVAPPHGLVLWQVRYADAPAS
ncbi:MAG TPA: tRNA pseudouridine(38-40) synthase TruA [Acidimicrobiales bacterium]